MLLQGQGDCGCRGCPVPDTSIDSRPDDPSNSGSASFSFSSNNENSTFECKLDDAGFTTCTSPKEYTDLSNGSHTFEVRATAANQADTSPASYTWTVEKKQEEALFRIVINGFVVNTETADHIFELDGKRDEVFIRYDTSLVDAEGTLLAPRTDITKQMGDIHTRPYRVQAGSASDLGGLMTGDEFPSTDPWRRTVPIAEDRVPIIAYEGPLVKDETGVAITPSIWEWDGGEYMLQSFARTIEGKGPAIYQAVATIITGAPLPEDTSEAGVFIEDVFDFVADVFGEAGDRPIGASRTDNSIVYEPQTLILDYERAVRLSEISVSGKGPGRIPFTFTDGEGIAGDGSYTLWVQVERLDTYNPDPQ